jgi:hypothetical protein
MAVDAPYSDRESADGIRFPTGNENVIYYQRFNTGN